VVAVPVLLFAVLHSASCGSLSITMLAASTATVIASPISS
jgi:hypothetical protein